MELLLELDLQIIGMRLTMESDLQITGMGLGMELDLCAIHVHLTLGIRLRVLLA